MWVGGASVGGQGLWVCGGRTSDSPVVHLTSLQQAQRSGDHRLEDLVSDGELRLKPLRQNTAVSKSSPNPRLLL